jgi:hypothetical protein
MPEPNKDKILRKGALARPVNNTIDNNNTNDHHQQPR